MEFGSAAGRGFESAFALYAWGAVILVALLLWVWFHRDIRKRERAEQASDERDE